MRGRETPVEIVEEQCTRRFALVEERGAAVRVRVPLSGRVDPQKALERWLDEKDDLLAGRVPRSRHADDTPVLRELVNSDAPAYGGSGVGNPERIAVEEVPWDGLPQSALLTLPPLGTVWLVPVPEKG